MAASSIEWTQQTWNPLAGCTAKSSGCLRCYAAVMTNRLGAMGQAKYKGLTVLQNGNRVFNGTIRLDKSALSIPLKRKKPTTYFVNSMSDLFWGDEDDLKTARRLGTENPQPVPFEFIDKVFAVMALCPQHTFQVLTKRPERMAAYMENFYPEGGRLERLLGMAQTSDDSPFDIATVADVERLSEIDVLPNVWLGTSVENQKAADERIPHLLKCPAAVRFLSAEPLLNSLRLGCYLSNNHTTRCPHSEAAAMPCIDWVIVGGESGPGARPCNVEWIRSIVGQCKAAGTAVFVKQFGANVLTDKEDSGWGSDWVPVYLQDEIRKTTLLGYRVHLKDKKGGTMEEWPADLRARSFPNV